MMVLNYKNINLTCCLDQLKNTLLINVLYHTFKITTVTNFSVILHSTYTHNSNKFIFQLIIDIRSDRF